MYREKLKTLYPHHLCKH